MKETKRISLRDPFSTGLNFETLKQKESCKLFTNFQNALSLLVRNRLLNRMRKAHRRFAQFNYVTFFHPFREISPHVFQDHRGRKGSVLSCCGQDPSRHGN